MDWDTHAAREETRYGEGLGRLSDEADRRQKQLARVAMAASGAGFARLMQGRRSDARAWFARSAERYRESFRSAPPESWGRLIGTVKARVLAGNWKCAQVDAEWALGRGPAESESPIGRYAAVLGALVLDDDARAGRLAAGLRDEPAEVFPQPVAAALAALAARDAEAYASAARDVLRLFETRDAYLEDVPVADTVIVLEALAGRRGIAAGLRSPLLPG
jgi:hypothetical protein